MALSMSACSALSASLAAAFVIGSAGMPMARETNTFVIAAAQGYGVEDCLAEGGECGHVVADAWCEAHGAGEALRFGVSGTNPAEAAGGRGRPYFITCGD